MSDADQLIASALRDIAAEAGLPGPVANAAWRAGRRRRAATLAASAASIAAAIALAFTVALPNAPAPRPAAPPPPTRFVSITLSPTTPARPGALTSAAQRLRDRALFLRLRDIKITTIGQNVVVTGPAADQAQLRNIATVGSLDFRQVLLYQPPAGPAYGDASLVNQHTLTLFHRLTCTPGDTSAWKAQVGYAAAADYDNPGTQVVACDSSGNKYALDTARVTNQQVAYEAARPSRSSHQWAVSLKLTDAGAAALGTLTTQLYTKYYVAARGNPATSDFWLDTIAVVVDGNVISAPETLTPILGGNLSIQGNISRAQAEVLAVQLQSGPLSVDFRVTGVSTFTVPSTPPPSSPAA